MWSSYRQGAKQEKDSGSCKCGFDADGARNGRGATNFVRRTKQKRSRYERFCARHTGRRRTKKSPAVRAAGLFAGGLHAKTKATSELFLPWHEPLPLSKAVYAHGWRFMRKLFCGLGFSATPIAGQCSGFAPTVIAASVIAARSAAVMRGAGLRFLEFFAARRHLFDWLVTGQVVPVTPAASVRGPRHQGNRSLSGSTPARNRSA